MRTLRKYYIHYGIRGTITCGTTLCKYKEWSTVNRKVGYALEIEVILFDQNELSHHSYFFLSCRWREFIFLSPSILQWLFLPCVRITVRQTRNHQATDVQYIASKRIIIPDPGPQKMPFVSLSELGFGNPAQNFMVCWIVLPTPNKFPRLI